MRQIQNKLCLTIVALALWLCPTVKTMAQDGTEEPIAVLKSSIYETQGENNVFQILFGGINEGHIDVDCGFGTVEYELQPAEYNSSDGTWSGTFVTCNVSKEGVVRIYGDADDIDVIYATGCYITDIELSKLKNLSILDLSHNEIKGLDLTGLTKLNALYLDDNPFDVKPLVVGGDKPDLMILEMGRIEGLDPSFNLSDYPELVTFDAWGNKGLTRLDPTGCPKLQKISIDSTPVSSLDVSKNPRLSILNISDTGIKSIDLSNNTYLTQLYCDHMSGTVNAGVKMSSIDVTKNPNLMYLYASGNTFTDIDVTQNRYLQDLFLNNNYLTSLNIDNNPNLSKVELRNNNFTFATLPLPGNWNTYEYTQRDMTLKKTYKEGDVIDLSDKVLREGTETTMALYTTSEKEPGVKNLVSDEYYTYADGKITVLKALPDSVYAAFANSAFPTSALDFIPFCTTKFMVKTAEDYGKDDIAFTFNVPIASAEGTKLSFGIGITGATSAEPKKFYVDYGNGKVEYQATSADAPAEPNVAEGVTTTGRVTVYVPEGEILSAIDMEDITLSAIDLSALHTLSSLRLVNAGLYSIDLSWNRNLRTLELTGNNFGSLNLRGANDAYQKNVLHDINLSNNGLTSVTLNDNFTLHNLNLSNNKLTELSFKDADMMKTLDLSNNNLTSLDVNYCTLMTSLNIAGNNITSLTLPTEISLKSLYCENNNFTFTTLPNLSGLDEYVYWPQHDVTISRTGQYIDLSACDPDGNTTYVWKKEDGTTLVNGTDYSEEDGKTRFFSNLIGTKVYCEMTNPLFGNLTLSTTMTVVAGIPTNVLASFTTTDEQTVQLVLAAKEAETPIYIDWKGTGEELDQYIVGTTATMFTAKTCKDVVAKVYSYSEESGLTVFSVTGAPISSIDASNMTELVCLTIKNAGLSDIKLPDSDDLFEIYLDGNNLSNIDLTRYANLRYLTLNDNKFTTFDASVYPNLNLLAIGDNKLTSVKLDNPNIWALTLSGNELEEIDLSGVPNVENLALGNNRLSQLDLSAMRNLKVMFLDYNKFKLSTLPLDNGYAKYTYYNQADIEVKVENGLVDLSSEAVINGTETTFRWFVGVPSYDDNGELVGDELIEGEDYNIADGVTTFLKPRSGVVCVMTNEQFPSLVLCTSAVDVVTTGISTATTDTSVKSYADAITVQTTSETTIRLYGVDGSLVRSARGTTTFSGLISGIYVVMVGDKAYKVKVG